MGFRDTLRFNRDAYRSKVSSQTDSDVLRKKHHAKIRTESTHVVAIFVHALSALASGGLSLTMGTSVLAAVYSARQKYVNGLQRKTIEAELRARGVKIPRIRKRDLIAGVGLGVAQAILDAVLPIVASLALESLRLLLEHLAGVDIQPIINAVALDLREIAMDIPEWILDCLTWLAGIPVKEFADESLEKLVRKKINKGI